MKSENTMHAWTVAKVIDDPANPYLKVLFLESARIYKLMRDHDDFARYSDLLVKAVENKARVHIRLTEAHGDIIEQIE